MGLTQELGLKKSVAFPPHEALLNIYYTASCLKKYADQFFAPFGLTDVQFNMMMLLKHQSGEQGGLSQAELSRMMLVNRANITSLVDRMEKTGLVQRTADDKDRRYNIVKLTSKGLKHLEEVEPIYAGKVKEIMSPLKEAEMKKLITYLKKVRTELKE
ncbi:MAG: MarR family transcriptional regulator [Sedimentisphaerales bacterium]|nr:MarR family transcriptional regulator [Sedimentisphaerales bacterium]